MHVSDRQRVKSDARWCIIPSHIISFPLMSERYLGSLVEKEIQMKNKISGEKRLQSWREAVSAFLNFLLSTDLENQYVYCPVKI